MHANRRATKYLNSLNDGRICHISTFDSKCKETGVEIVRILKENLDADIFYIGSSVLEIAGGNDIDISVVSKNGKFNSDFEKMKNIFGEPKEVKVEREYVKWEFVKNSFKVESYLNGKMSSLLQEQINTHDILSNNENFKKEYESLKLKFNNKNWKDYMSAKLEFFNKLLKPTLYLLCGLPGSGKSYWSKLQEDENTIRISHDEEFFAKYGKVDTGTKHDQFSDTLKLELIDKITELLKQNKNVILDYGFWKKKDREEYKNKFIKLAYVKLLYFKVPKEIRYERVLSRDKKDNHDLNLEALEKFETVFEEPDSKEVVYII